MYSKIVCLFCLLLWSCMPGVVVNDKNLKACLDTIDNKLLVSDQNPEGFIDVLYNQSYNLPELTLRPDNKANIRILSMNIGNASTKRTDGVHAAYDLRLTYRTYEDAIAQRIAALNPKPHIIAFQEVLTKKRCALLSQEDRSSDIEKTCWDQKEDQVQRLAGPDYAIVCDGNEGIDCLAILKSFASIVGLSDSYYPSLKSHTAPLPPPVDNPDLKLSTCDYSKGECHHFGFSCDPESSVAAVRLKLKNGTYINVVFLHPTAIGEVCQQAQLLQTFELATKNLPEKTLILGDWNMDMIRYIGNNTVAFIAKKYIGVGREFRLHNNIDESCAFTKTSPFGFATVDHVVSNFARGICRVYQSNGMSTKYYSPLKNFDHGILEEIFAGREIPASYKKRSFDHNSILCDLYTD